MASEITCAQCGAPATDDDRPCRICGSAERRLRVERDDQLPALEESARVEVQPARGQEKARRFTAGSLVLSHKLEAQVGRVVETLPTIVRVVEITGPTGPGGSYTALVWDEGRNRLFEATEQKTLEEALLAVEEAFKPQG